MARSYRVKIDDIYLTRSGNQVSGDPCELELTNVEDLQTDFTGSSVLAIDGTRVTQIFGPDETAFEVKITKLYSDVYSRLKAAANANLAVQAQGGNANFEFTAVGDMGDVAIQAIWNIEKPFRAARAEEGRVYEITLRFFRKLEI